jgi:hypothetical protein
VEVTLFLAQYAAYTNTPANPPNTTTQITMIVSSVLLDLAGAAVARGVEAGAAGAAACKGAATGVDAGVAAPESAPQNRQNLAPPSSGLPQLPQNAAMVLPHVSRSIRFCSSLRRGFTSSRCMLCHFLVSDGIIPGSGGQPNEGLPTLRGKQGRDALLSSMLPRMISRVARSTLVGLRK